jgi:hypothetical protein
MNAAPRHCHRLPQEAQTSSNTSHVHCVIGHRHRRQPCNQLSILPPAPAYPSLVRSSTPPYSPKIPVTNLPPGNNHSSVTPSFPPVQLASHIPARHTVGLTSKQDGDTTLRLVRTVCRRTTFSGSGKLPESPTVF